MRSSVTTHHYHHTLLKVYLTNRKMYRQNWRIHASFTLYTPVSSSTLDNVKRRNACSWNYKRFGEPGLHVCWLSLYNSPVRMPFRQVYVQYTPHGPGEQSTVFSARRLRRYGPTVCLTTTTRCFSDVRCLRLRLFPAVPIFLPCVFPHVSN